jgi:hypothetical protein
MTNRVVHSAAGIPISPPDHMASQHVETTRCKTQKASKGRNLMQTRYAWMHVPQRTACTTGYGAR